MLSAASVLASACSLMQPSDNASDKAAVADRLARDSKHVDAANAYADLAQSDASRRDHFMLRSAQEWIAAGNFPAARQALNSASPALRTQEPTTRAFAAAQIGIGQNDGPGALRELDSIPVPNQVDDAQNYWSFKGRAAFLSGRPTEGVRAFVERERFVRGSAALLASRQELFARIRTAAEHGAALRPTPEADSVIAGWLEIGPVAIELSRNPMGASNAIAKWRNRFPQHPANDGVLPAAQSQLAQATEFPDQIALLLPLSGRSEAVGVAVRDGFIAAYLEQQANSHPRIRVYDVAAESVASAYERAIRDGANFVVGPLTKEDVAAIAPLTAGRAPVLALNFLSNSTGGSQNLYQFALLPEDEARAAARRLLADGKLKGVALAPSNEFGTRVMAAFADELAHLGGELLDSARYEPARADFSDVIHQVLQVHDVKGEPSSHRTDATFIFVVGSAGAVRLIRPQLKFHYAGDVPMYCISDSFEPDPSANVDMDGVIFADMPWMIANDQVTSQIRNQVRAAWPARAARRGRLYAFGFDAYRLVPALRSKSPDALNDISGMTGRLRLDEHNRIRRDLDWAEIKGGVPRAL